MGARHNPYFRKLLVGFDGFPQAKKGPSTSTGNKRYLPAGLAATLCARWACLDRRMQCLFLLRGRS
jgi:hypothetical protein